MSASATQGGHNKFWYNQDIIYNFQTQLQGTESHSEFSYEES